jgi:sugar O-acyltransferase (sialic acid O-acetyltransferase NeuD family)
MSMLPRLLVFGGGGHAKVVIDAAEKSERFSEILVADDDPAMWGKLSMGYVVIGGRDAVLAISGERPLVNVAIGVNATRATVSVWMQENGFELATVMHPSVQLGRGVRIGAGSFLAAGAVVNSDATLESNVIVNTAAAVDHDCQVGAAVHLGPGCRLCGNVSVGRQSLLGAGVVVIPSVRIGVSVLVGAGSTVIGDLADGVRVAGSPARALRQGT